MDEVTFGVQALTLPRLDFQATELFLTRCLELQASLWMSSWNSGDFL